MHKNSYKTMSDYTLYGSGYAAPAFNIYTIPAEIGFTGSTNFGEEGRTGNINYGNENDIDI